MPGPPETLPAELDPAEQAFREGDWARARQLASALAESPGEPSTVSAAREFVSRFAPDPIYAGILVTALALFGLCLSLIGCAPTHKALQVHPWRTDAPLSDFFPLHEGDTWGYDLIDEATHDRAFLVNRVAHSDAQKATIQSGSKVTRYDLRSDAIVRADSNTMILRSPLSVGTTWEVPGGRATITAIDATVPTVNRSYPRCVVVEEVTEGRRLATSYAEGAGPVKIEIYSRDPAGEHLAQRGLLRSFRLGSQPSQ